MKEWQKWRWFPVWGSGGIVVTVAGNFFVFVFFLKTKRVKKGFHPVFCKVLLKFTFFV
jgi:hypothetical protein